MSTDLFKDVLFNDGEGLTHGDLNDNQRFLTSRLWDQLIHGQIGSISTASASRDLEFGGQDGADHPSTLCYCVNPGAAYLRQGSANNKIQVAPGTLLQKLSTITGDDAKLVPYTFAGTEEWTLTAGDATNPRIDLLQMSLVVTNSDSQSRDFEDATTRVVSSTSMNKKRRVVCTLSVKTGTPAASPTIPEPDSGCVVVGTCMVGNTWATAGNAPIFGEDTAATANLVVHDQRMPLRVRAYWVDPTDFKLVTNWALSNANSTVTSSNATNDMYVVCPAGLGRLVGIGIHHTTNAFSSQLLGRSSGIIISSFASRISVAQLTSGGLDVTPYFTFEATQSASAGPTINQSSTTKIGVPIWTNGRRCPHEAMRLGSAGSVPADRLVLRIQSGNNASVVGYVVFYVAEGL